MSALPRGITQVVWKNKTKAKGRQVAFRVRMSRNVNGSLLKVDRLFDTLEEAKDFLATCQSNIGRQGRCCINQLQARFSQPQTWLRHSHRLRAAQLSKPIEDRCSNVQLVDLPLERA